MFRDRLLLLICLACTSASAQDQTVNAWTIAGVLNTSQNQWVFNHICVPKKFLSGHEFTQGEFVDAYLIVSKLRWGAALEALSKEDEKESMKSLALILHGIIDAYWPGRVEREANGSIVSFRDCDELGDLQGMLREEKSGPGPQGETKELTIKLMSEVIRKWKERRPFEEVLPLLVSGPMKIAAEAAARKLADQ